VSARRAEEEEEGISSGPPQPDRGFGRVQHQDAVGYRSVQTGAVVSWVWRVTSVQIIAAALASAAMARSGFSARHQPGAIPLATTR
jgi:hypothetical protein